ncbi:hypothetical protein ALP93_200259 [Pseudomonas syringae pv. helianthi]|nr:hypothetical protein ALP93_200259 [Pseudomonas syringae pv. helianthi]
MLWNKPARISSSLSLTSGGIPEAVPKIAASVATELAARSPTLDLKPAYCKTLLGNDTTDEMAPAFNALGSRSLMDHSSPFMPLMMASTHMVSRDSIIKGGTESIPANCRAY